MATQAKLQIEDAVDHAATAFDAIAAFIRAIEADLPRHASAASAAIKHAEYAGMLLRQAARQQ